MRGMTNRISAQVSLYPLRQARLTPLIDKAVQMFRKAGLGVEPGRMSTVILGDQEAIFAAVQEVFRTAATQGDVVMQVSFSNACPTPTAAVHPEAPQ
jgi:uncharacterized protein YqgV (UPF0045/DUF77 family)